MITIEPTKTQIRIPPLSAQQLAVLKLLGTLIAHSPKLLVALLLDFRVDVPEEATSSELTELTMIQIERNDAAFNRKLAKLMLKEVTGTEDAFDGGGGVTVGADPVSAIAGAVGSIFNVAGGLIGKKERKKAARRESMRSTMMLFQQREDQQRQAQLAVHAQTLRSKTIETVGILLLVALLGGLFIWRMRKTKTPKTQHHIK